MTPRVFGIFTPRTTELITPSGDGWGAGSDSAKAYADAIWAGFPDYRETIEDIVVEGARVCVKLRIKGTHAAPFP